MSTFYFYDLETTGISPKYGRIMQFAGRRVNEKLEPVGEPDDIYIKLNRDILPEPDAVLITGITPQKTLIDGSTEAEFLRYFESDIATPDTIFVGFNSIRFDDEFMRYTLYRNFYDPYEWQWKDGRSRWDILDLIRAMRALRPDGINWPIDSEGKATNRLELLTAANNIDHTQAHTALADVDATIELARLILKAQPKLFSYMLDMRDKKKVRAFVNSGEPFAYVSGRYESRYDKMTVAALAAELIDGSGALVYDLRYDPTAWASKTDAELAEAFNTRSEIPEERLPYKTLQYNRCPSIAPYGVVDAASAERLHIDHKVIAQNYAKLQSSKELTSRVMKLIIDKKKSYQTALLPDESSPDTRLYENFIPDHDKAESMRLRKTSLSELKTLIPDFEDGRLQGLYPLYKARNFPAALSDAERSVWDAHINAQLFAGGESSRVAKFMERIMELAARKSLTQDQKYLLEELKLYAESITPAAS